MSVAAAVLLVSMAVAFGFWFDRFLGIGDADHAEWLELPGGPAVLVAGARYESPESGASYYTHSWVVVDAATGEIVGRHAMGDSYDFPGSVHGPALLTGAGEVVLYRGEEGLVLYDLATEAAVSGKVLDAMFPDVAAPWFQVRVTGAGHVAVEADDKRWWDLDVGHLSATQAEPSTASADWKACVALGWPQADGREWRFVETPTERHSDTRNWGLASVRALDYGQFDDAKPLGLRVEYGFFLCDQRTGKAATFPDGSALVGTWRHEGDATWTDFGQLAKTGEIAWSTAIDAPGGPLTEAFGYDGGFVVRQGSRLVSIDAHGKIRWQKDL